MSKEELLKIQTCTLKVDIHCDGCKRKVRKVLLKIEGVYKVSVDSEQGKVTVSGNVDPPTLIKKLEKCGKPAQLSDNMKPNQLDNQIQPQKSGSAPQQLKAFQDLKLLPSLGGGDKKGGHKSVTFKVPEIDENDDDDDEYDDEFDDEFDDDDDEEDDDSDDDEEEDDDDFPMKKPVAAGCGGSQMGNTMMNPQLMKEHGIDVKKGVGGGETQNKSGNINVNGMPNTSGGTGHGISSGRFHPMMNQPPNANERFQPMMYAQPPYPYPYPYPQGDPLTHLFSDDNTSSCYVM